MNPNIYDADLTMGQHRQLAQSAADSYHHTRHLARRGLRAAYRAALVAAGGALIAVGHRLQGEIDVLAAPERAEALTFRANGANPY